MQISGDAQFLLCVGSHSVPRLAGRPADVVRAGARRHRLALVELVGVLAGFRARVGIATDVAAAAEADASRPGRCPGHPSVVHVKRGCCVGVQPPSTQVRPAAQVSATGRTGRRSALARTTLPPVHCVRVGAGRRVPCADAPSPCRSRSPWGTACSRCTKACRRHRRTGLRRCTEWHRRTGPAGGAAAREALRAGGRGAVLVALARRGVAAVGRRSGTQAGDPFSPLPRRQDEALLGQPGSSSSLRRGTWLSAPQLLPLGQSEGFVQDGIVR